jgi:hypothetical protein
MTSGLSFDPAQSTSDVERRESRPRPGVRRIDQGHEAE